MEIAYTGAALKALTKLDQQTRNRLKSKLVSMAAAGSADVKKLAGREGNRVRIGDWRVIYTVEGETIVVHAIGHRSKIYR